MPLRPLVCYLFSAALICCDRPDGDQRKHPLPASSAPATSASAAPAAQPPAPTKGREAAAATPNVQHPPARTEGCPEGMVRVEGEYCPALVQECLVHHQEYEGSKGNKNVSERCLKYRSPSRCVVKKREQLSFCMDRYEFPNQIGELPRVLTSWLQAKGMCESLGKRLCTEDEFNYACEGPEMRPYVYGFERSDKLCNIDREYRFPDHSRQMLTYDDCQKDERCKAELQRLDQRHRIGSVLTCVSWSGVVDMNGNVNEWVVRRGDKPPPHRSGLKGGWWGPVRSRCRPTVDFHKEYDYGYEAGFRCCKDADASPPAGGG